eukprot:snap_masked-scaffold370_size193435-processed-gene-0.22 protein:Tk07799 transcript:snap_masked-scaffold370_size193435-processed-gene-0.22-mRNA-1 annotation:"dynein light chain axonemal"
MPTTIKQALKKWEEATQRKAAESKEIKLIGVSPPIEKMEGPFHLLVNLEKFSLSTNMISSISNLQSFKNLRVLSLGRNVLKSLQGVEAAADTLEQLWISYNQIDKLKPLRNLLKLKVLYMAHNHVREWREFEHMSELPVLEDLVFIGNPLEEDVTPTGRYTDDVIKRLLYLKKLDGYPVIREVEEEETEELSGTMDLQEIDRMAAGEDDLADSPKDHVDDEDDEEETQAPSDTED